MGERKQPLERHLELAQIQIFERALQDACATRKARFPWGTALWHDELTKVWDLNFLRVETHTQDISAEELASEAEHLQSDLAHRRITVMNQDVAARLDDEFRWIGWECQRLVYMINMREPDRRADIEAEELDEPTHSAARQKIMAGEEYGQDPEVRTQLVERAKIVMNVTNMRFYGARVDGEVVSVAESYSNGSVAQIEDVFTLQPHRNKGLSRAVVIRAVEDAKTEGHDIIFLVADYDDWPKEMYKKLGFDELALTANFSRKL